MDGTEKTPRVKHEQKNITMHPALKNDIETFMHNAGPTMRRIILASSVLASGEPHKDEISSFIAYAIRLALNKPNPQSVGRTFGTKIEQSVLEIMDRNMVAHDNGEWWNVQVIGTGTLRDAGHNPTSVKRWIEENYKRLAEHHAAVGIPPAELTDWNRKAGVYRNALKKEGK